jgi:peptidyl-tRNA hydrolase
MDPLLSTIVVRDTANFTLHQLAEASAKGVFGMLSSCAVPEATYSTWVNSGMRKIAKRLKPRDFTRYIEAAPEGYLVVYGELELFVTTPHRRSEEHPLLKRAQVAGFTTLSTSVFEVDHMTHSYISITLNSELGMTAGKAAAAAGHIAQLAGEKLASATDDMLDMWSAWRTSDFQFVAFSAPLSEADVATSLVHVQDAGHTEVEAGAVTALGRWVL